MLVLIWASLLFSVRGSNADTNASVGERKEHCQNGFCITLNEGEITAEAGLCVVIPCSFTTGSDFIPKYIVWSKCDAEKPRCSDSDRIFHTNRNNSKIQPGFRGRVSLLEPDVNQRNCSIIINDLTESDSGSYQLRVNGLKYTYTYTYTYKSDGFTFTPRATISVKDLMQKPTLMIPPLMEGKQTTLTCTAPGLCSGSVPQITWTWRGEGENDSHITGNVTAVKNESVTSVAQRYSSTLTFDPSAEHHGTSVTCKVGFRNNITAEETVTLNVTYTKKPVITGRRSLEEGDALNLTCSFESFPPSRITWTILGSNKKLHNESRSYLQSSPGSATLVIHNMAVEHSGKYICTAQHLNTTVAVYADVTVTLFPKILKDSGCKVQSGVLTCVCISQGFPLPTIKWPLLEKLAKYSVFTTVSNHTINSTITLTVKDHSNATVQCVSRNEKGEVQQNINIMVTSEGQEGKRTHNKQHQKPKSLRIGEMLLSSIWGNFLKILYREGRNREVKRGRVSSEQKHWGEEMITIRVGKTDCFKHQIKMFLLIWVTLLFSVRDSNADASLGERKEHCQNGFCITLNEGEITAEAGLCVVIPCSFTPGSDFTPKYIVWSKCDAQKSRCSDSERIFHSYKYNSKIQSGFRGRVSLLEPDVNQRNCSIIINDLTESDSGSYQLRVNGLKYMYLQDGFTFTPRATISVKDLMQKPTLMIPPLTEGKQATLTCTAPGLCSGSVPQITWTWRGKGENDSHITGNVTAVKNESVTSVAQRYSSTLTFDPSAEHHGTSVTCKVGFRNNITAEETVTLNVTYVKEVKITGNTSVKEGETLNLNCSVESFPPSLVTWTKFSDKNMQNGTKNNLQNDTFTDLQNDTKTYPQEEKTGVVTYSVSNVTAEDSGRYICTAKYLNNTLMEKVDVRVIYTKEPVITGRRSLEEGDALNLTCSVESFPPSRITWTILGSNKKLHNESRSYLQSSPGSATLVIHNMAVEHSGKYICTAQHLNTTVAVYANVTVTLFPKILKDSGCKVQSEVRTCVCMSRGFPLPTIKWPLLKKHTEYLITTSVSNRAVNSSITLSVKDGSNATVECVSSNENGEAKKNLTTRTDTPEEKEQSKEILKIVSRLEVIVAFFSGILLSAFICCLVTKCHRKKQKSSGNLDKTLEMVTTQEDPLIDDDEAVEDDQTYYQEAAEEEEVGGGGGGAVATEKAALNLDDGPKDVEYASIDFSMLKRKSKREAAKTQETTETEYAEIKKVKEEREDNDREEGEVEEEAMMVEEAEEEEEIKHDVPEEEEREDMEVYSNVKDIMSEI
ncbi:uncharacterized protein LOC104930299 [Larimichthys crocea]|uniref:uncharacterized protein LOC104930299 n=1 Tax=Larimichthys crocea TaxID=215358 RepID=UPI000F5E914A|nr:uncharacterized protein LOC104930299 [Larimichthys crocea]